MNRIEAATIARAAKAKLTLPLPDRFWSKVNVRSRHDCWEWAAAVRKKTEGYGAFWMGGRHQPASKVAWVLTNGDVPSGLQVLHTCDNPPCCNPAHLFLGTNRQNNADKVSKKRHVFGVRVATAKLTPENVLKIRALKSTMTQREIAAEFNITPAYVGEICRRESWKHL